MAEQSQITRKWQDTVRCLTNYAVRASLVSADKSRGHGVCHMRDAVARRIGLCQRIGLNARRLGTSRCVAKNVCYFVSRDWAEHAVAL